MLARLHVAEEGLYANNGSRGVHLESKLARIWTPASGSSVMPTAESV